MGTGIDIPTWYQAEMSELWEVLRDYANDNAAPGSRLDVGKVHLWGREGVGQLLDVKGGVAGYALAYRGAGGWRATAMGDESILPRWYREKMYYLSE
jgi:hypothetical protein